MTDIRITALSKCFGGQPVLRNIDLVAPDRTVLALLGPSGCGKTTLLRLIAGFERADSGEIMFGDQLVESANRTVPPERRRVGYVPQEGSLFPHLTVAGNVSYGLPRHARGEPRVAAILDLVGLTEFADRYPYQLSGGQQQRVALARALAPGPALVLLDEPFNALDLDLRRSMFEDVVALLRRTASTVVLVTHDPGEAFVTADTVAVMQDGMIMQCASPSVVYRTPASPTVARLTGPAIFLEGALSGEGIETPLGVLPMQRHPGRAANRMVAMLRPEQIVLTTGPEGRMARVIGHRFHGDHSTLTVAGDGFKFDVHSRSYDGEPTIRLQVIGSCVVFAAER
jgi:iron(III) transport system ATP-binding protein